METRHQKKRLKKNAKKRSNPPLQNGTVLRSDILEEGHQLSDKETGNTTDRDYVATDPSCEGDTSVSRSRISRHSQHADDIGTSW